MAKDISLYLKMNHYLHKMIEEAVLYLENGEKLSNG